jgi:predicted RNA-binding protein with PUA-like domain
MRTASSWQERAREPRVEVARNRARLGPQSPVLALEAQGNGTVEVSLSIGPAIGPPRSVLLRDPRFRLRQHFRRASHRCASRVQAQLPGRFPNRTLLPYDGPMAYFLFKTEPDVYSFDNFLRDKETIWDGVTNPTAVKYLREMKAGTKWIFYHTGDERTAVGTGTVLSVDATDPKVPIVKVKAGKRIKTPKTLAAIKAEPLFANSPLVIIGRLSVVPLTEEQWSWLVE